MSADPGSTLSILEELFHAALELPPAERAAWLERACGDEVRLRRKVEDLLAAHGAAGDFLEVPVVQHPRPAGGLEGPGDRIGPYELREVLGEGGFGTVYRATQDEPVRREVALKVLKPGMDTRRFVARFEAERQALAGLRHPGIATVLDAGATESGRPYFVMELVHGEPLLAHCDRSRDALEARLELFIELCHAVQHAHEHGLVHRDLKPSNVLVEVHDGGAWPKVIDFGVAKALHGRTRGDSLDTQLGQLVGTPVYMAPEQARGDRIDGRADVYSLGVVLYELLVGDPPVPRDRLDGLTPDQVRLLMLESDPEPPASLLRRLPASLREERAAQRSTTPSQHVAQLEGDLTWILLRALEKEPRRRYARAADLALDVRRALDHLPVEASPPSRAYRLRKLARRHRVALAAGSAVLSAILAGMVLAVLGLLRATDEAQHSRAMARFLQELLAPDFLGSPVQDPHEVVRRARDLFGEDHAAVITVLSEGALRFELAGRSESALPLAAEALRVAQETYGPEDLRVASLHGQVGRLCRRTGDDEAAWNQLERARVLGGAVPDLAVPALADAYQLLAEMCSERGQQDRAVELLTDALAVRRAGTPSAHLQLEHDLDLLAQALSHAGREEEAAAIWREQLAENREAHGPRSTALAMRRIDHAQWLFAWGRHEQAEPELRAALSVLRTRDVLVEERLTALQLLAELLEVRGDSQDELDPLRVEILDVGRSVWPEDSQRLTEQLLLVSDTFARRGRTEEAFDLLLEALENRQADQAARTSVTDRLLELVRQVTLDENRAEAQLRAAETALSTLFGRIGESTGSLVALAAVMQRLGEAEASREPLQKAREMVTQEKRSPDLPALYALFAREALDRGDRDEAEQLLAVAESHLGRFALSDSERSFVNRLLEQVRADLAADRDGTPDD